MIAVGADVKRADYRGVTCLHFALTDHATVDFGVIPRVRKTKPREFDQAPNIAKVSQHHQI